MTVVGRDGPKDDRLRPRDDLTIAALCSLNHVTEVAHTSHILTRKSRLQPGEFLISSAKRLLQQYRHERDIEDVRFSADFEGRSGHQS